MSSNLISIFLSYNFGDQEFVQMVCRYLRRQSGLDIFFYNWVKHGHSWQREVTRGLADADCFVLFRGKTVGATQKEEVVQWMKESEARPGSKNIIVQLQNAGAWPEPSLNKEDDKKFFNFREEVAPLLVRALSGRTELGETEAAHCAAEITRSLLDKWIPPDGLPENYIFHYEKDVIAAFASPTCRPKPDLLRAGCPETWPHIAEREGPRHQNPLSEEDIGGYRQPDSVVLVDIRSKYHRIHNPPGCPPGQAECCLVEKGLTFPEAGPRKYLRHGTENPLNVGILVAGGIAPGINAVIAGIVDRHRLYWKKHVDTFPKSNPTLIIRGYRDGFSGLIGERCHKIQFTVKAQEDPQYNKELAYVMDNANSGGSMFGTSRYNPLADLRDLKTRNQEIDNVLGRLWHDRIDILYIIGGDGSLKAAHALDVLNKQYLAEKKPGSRPFSLIGIPKTMDNDILWVWQSFGFLSAVEKASDCLRQLHTEASSNPRLCVIQLFGSDSGFTVSHAALASLLCDAALIPEMRFDMEGLFSHIQKRLAPRYQPAQQSESPFGIIVMAETAVPDDWFCYAKWEDYFRAKQLTTEQFLESLKDIPQPPDKPKSLAQQMQELLATGDKGRFTVNLDTEEIDAILDFMRNNRRVYGQTPDPLRAVSLKLVSRVLQHKIRKVMGDQDTYWQSFRVFTNEPRHLLRAIAPSSNDITTGRRFGTLAVDNAMAGYTDFMISQWLTEYVLVPLPLVVLGRKRVPSEGIFWKSVLAKTEQRDLCVRDTV